jgi:GMP/IMP 5'-nucleotidase
LLKIISFDMNGTLTQDRFIELVWLEGIPKLYSRAKEIPYEKAKEYVFSEYKKVGEGRIEWYDIKYWFRFFGLGEDWRWLLKSLEHEVKSFPEVPSVLEELSKAYQLILTTNAYREFVDLELEATGLNGYFMRIFSSTSDFGEVKKTPQVYSKICQILGVKPEEIAHIGDHRLFDFAVPKELGIQAFYLDRTGGEEGDFIVRNMNEFRNKLRLYFPRLSVDTESDAHA